MGWTTIFCAFLRCKYLNQLEKLATPNHEFCSSCFMHLACCQFFAQRHPRTLFVAPVGLKIVPCNQVTYVKNRRWAQAAQAQVVCHMILRNSAHSEIIRVCMGIFTICFRKHKYYKILNKNTLSYFHGLLLAVCALTFPICGDFCETPWN